LNNLQSGCSVMETILNRRTRAVVMENDKLKVTILPEKGADIYEFIYKPKNIDVLLKTPGGLRGSAAGFQTTGNSQVAWMENYEGGWQEVFPSGGGPCDYKGVEMNFHGEVCTLAWSFEVTVNTPEKVAVTFFVETYRSPFRVEKTLTLIKNETFLKISEKITNLAEEEMDYMWGHHPAFGAPFLDEDVIIDLPQGSWIESQNREDQSTRMPQKSRFKWPIVKGKKHEDIDLSILPSKVNRSADLAFIGGFSEGWYGITNPQLGFGFGMAWPKEIFPHMWFWQELKGSFGWPWYGRNYAMAIEPFTSFDESGLAHCVDNGTARKIGAGESLEVNLAAGCFDSEKGINKIDIDGNVDVKYT
jgi:galactose mutarotase-like enzyme